MYVCTILRNNGDIMPSCAPPLPPSTFFPLTKQSEKDISRLKLRSDQLEWLIKEKSRSWKISKDDINIVFVQQEVIKLLEEWSSLDSFELENKILGSYLLLTLSPAAEKRRRYQGIGLRRPQATRIVEGLYDCCRELSLVPANEMCVCEWRGAPCT